MNDSLIDWRMDQLTDWLNTLDDDKSAGRQTVVEDLYEGLRDENSQIPVYSRVILPRHPPPRRPFVTMNTVQ